MFGHVRHHDVLVFIINMSPLGRLSSRIVPTPMVWILTAYLVMDYIVMAYIVLAYLVMVYIVMAYIVVAYRVMAYVVMATAPWSPGPSSGCGLCSYVGMASVIAWPSRVRTAVCSIIVCSIIVCSIIVCS